MFGLSKFKKGMLILITVLVLVVALFYKELSKFVLGEIASVSTVIARSYNLDEQEKLGYKIADRIRNKIIELSVKEKLPFPPKNLVAPYLVEGLTPYALLLPPVVTKQGLPNPREVSNVLFKRDQFIPSDRMTVLGAFFVNFIFENIIVSDFKGQKQFRYKDETIRYIDMSGYQHLNENVNLYAVYNQSNFLRAYKDGKMAMQKIEVNGNLVEFPPFASDIKKKYPEFEVFNPMKLDESKMFALGKPFLSAITPTSAFVILFLREHNRVCDLLKVAYPELTDEQLFNTARNIVTAQAVKILYNQHGREVLFSAFKPAKFKVDTFSFDTEYIMPFEFNLLYHWHVMMPDEIEYKGVKKSLNWTMFNVRPLIEDGIAPMFAALSQAPAGKMGPYNTSKYLRNLSLEGGNVIRDVEAIAIQKGRDLGLQSFNDYREKFEGVERFKNWSDFSSNPKVQADLKKLYKHPDDVDLYVGAMVSDNQPGTVFTKGMEYILFVNFVRMVWSSEFVNNFLNEESLTPVGMEIYKKASLKKLLEDNLGTSEGIELSIKNPA